MQKAKSLLEKLFVYRQYLGIVFWGSFILMYMLPLFLTDTGIFYKIVLYLVSAVLLLSFILLIYFRLIYKRQLLAQSQREFTQEEAEQFWITLRNRQNLFRFIGCGWMVVGGPLIFFLSKVVRFETLMVVLVAIMAVFFIVWSWAGWHVRKMRCYSCGEEAIFRLYLWSENDKCQSCGINFKLPKP